MLMTYRQLKELLDQLSIQGLNQIAVLENDGTEYHITGIKQDTDKDVTPYKIKSLTLTSN